MERTLHEFRIKSSYRSGAGGASGALVWGVDCTLTDTRLVLRSDSEQQQLYPRDMVGVRPNLLTNGVRVKLSRIDFLYLKCKRERNKHQVGAWIEDATRRAT